MTQEFLLRSSSRLHASCILSGIIDTAFELFMNSGLIVFCTGFEFFVLVCDGISQRRIFLMADTEMQEQDVLSGVDTKAVEEEERSEPEKDQNSIERPKSPVPQDKTLTLESDVHLSDAPITNQTEANEEVGGQNNVDGKNGDVDQSEKKITSDVGQEETHLGESTSLKGEPSSPHVVEESVKKWKTWLLSDSEVM